MTIETKGRSVRDAEFWGAPVGTPLPLPKGVGRQRRSITPKAKLSSPLPKTGSGDSGGGDKTPDVTPADGEQDFDLEALKPLPSDRFSIPGVSEQLKKIKRDGRPEGKGTVTDPIDCGDDVVKAQALLLDGKHIRLNTEVEVSILIDKVAEEAAQAKKEGRDAPEYNFCAITIPGTNLFCSENKGVKRDLMPQFGGKPENGSYADTKFDPKKKESDVMDEFALTLKAMGIAVEEKEMRVQDLKATQNELVGAKVAGIRGAMRKGLVKEEAIYVTRDGYVVDGHHRWAAKMALDLEDGKLGDVSMSVKVIDADIGYALDLANGFTRLAGIKPKGTGENAEGVKMIDITEFYLSTVNDLLDTFEAK